MAHSARCDLPPKVQSVSELMPFLLMILLPVQELASQVVLRQPLIWHILLHEPPVTVVAEMSISFIKYWLMVSWSSLGINETENDL